MDPEEYYELNMMAAALANDAKVFERVYCRKMTEQERKRFEEYAAEMQEKKKLFPSAVFDIGYN